jgi:hypothetical protein
MIKQVSNIKISEAKHQAAFFEWLGNKHPKLRKVCFAVPNGGARNVREAANLKRQGVTKGVCDIICLIPNQTKHGLLIEMKTGNNKPSLEQVNFMNCAIANGYKATVCYSVNEATKVFEDHINED